MLKKFNTDSDVWVDVLVPSKQTAIDFLAQDIKDLLHKGWTYQRVCDFLSGKGIGCTPSTLAGYLRRWTLKVQQEQEPQEQEQQAQAI